MNGRAAQDLDTELDAAGLGQHLNAHDRHMLYEEMKAVAHRQRRAIGAPASLQTTALVHEAWLRLRDNSNFRSRGHFMASAAMAMRYVLIDHVRAQTSDKRTQPADTSMDDDDTLEQIEPCRYAEILAVHAALEDLSAIRPRCVRVVECRYFAGYTDAEISLGLNINERTVRRDWEYARAWLHDRLGDTLVE